MTGYSILYADCPWRFEVFDRETGLAKSPDRHYRTMAVEEIAALPVAAMAAKDAFLVMWVYDPLLPAAFTVAKAWGFRKFITPLFRWFKTTDGQLRLFDPTPRPGFSTGYHTRGGACEECWLFRRGRGLPVLRHDIRKEFFAPIREHSRKPDEVAGWIVDLYGDAPRVELFARTARPGWDAWGNEVGKFPARRCA
ncbi:MT-A70 family methyltransferase [Shumkonia mesophila]|uniref:MT-A70 family methyltransferase n=1 Tax=Shumkonia mesophila TaxID=2838854 RepID=UPI0029345E0B|nr:MT-A70 family methyltransferase [Shumkonia mesophila]